MGRDGGVGRVEALRWSRLRPATTGSRAAAIAAGLFLTIVLGTGISMVLIGGGKALGGLALVAFTLTVRLLYLAIVVAGLAWWAWRRSAPLASALLVGSAGLLVAMSVVPASAQWARARDYGVSLSIGELLGPSSGSGRATQPKTVTTSDGAELRVDVWTAGGATATPRPAVVLVHGGAFVSGAPGGLPEWNRHLPDLGFVVLDVAYRMPVSGPGFAPEMEVGDVKCAVGWARQHAADLGIDPDRISLMGHSAGGNLVLLAAYTAGDPELPPTCAVPDEPPRAVVALYPPTDLRVMWDESRPRDDARSALVQYLGGPPAEQPEQYRRFSPASHVRADVPPTITVMGESDQIVPVDDVRAFADLLEQAGAPHEAWYLPGTDHAFDASWGSFNTQIARAKIDAFLRQHA